MNLVDYHVHTSYCGHAEGSVLDYVQAGREQQLSEMAITDHFPIYHLETGDPRCQEYAMDENVLGDYLNDISEAQLAVPEIPVRTGFEVDYIPGWEGYLKERLDSLPLDVVLGSVHFIDEWAIDDPREIDRFDDWESPAVWQAYFERLQKAAASNLFQVIAHPDLPKKLDRLGAPPDELLQQTAAVLAGTGTCIEINTSGRYKPVGEWYPATPFLQLCLEKGVDVTIGSDAHRPEHVGRDLSLAARFLKSLGCRRITVFRERKKQYRYL